MYSLNIYILLITKKKLYSVAIGYTYFENMTFLKVSNLSIK